MIVVFLEGGIFIKKKCLNKKKPLKKTSQNMSFPYIFVKIKINYYLFLIYRIACILIIIYVLSFMCFNHSIFFSISLEFLLLKWRTAAREK